MESFHPADDGGDIPHFKKKLGVGLTW